MSEIQRKRHKVNKYPEWKCIVIGNQQNSKLKLKLENAWQSLAYSPVGAVVSLPI